MSNKKAILCVDDEIIILRSLKELLTQRFNNQYIVEIAESGEEALEIIEMLAERKIDTLLVISDWLMPEMKGDELLVKIHQKFPHMAKIMLSGHAAPEAIQRAYKEAKLNNFIAKPWDEDKLLKEIQAYLN